MMGEIKKGNKWVTTVLYIVEEVRAMHAKTTENNVYKTQKRGTNKKTS